MPGHSWFQRNTGERLSKQRRHDDGAVMARRECTGASTGPNPETAPGWSMTVLHLNAAAVYWGLQICLASQNTPWQALRMRSRFCVALTSVERLLQTSSHAWDPEKAKPHRRSEASRTRLPVSWTIKNYEDLLERCRKALSIPYEEKMEFDTFQQTRKNVLLFTKLCKLEKLCIWKRTLP